MLYAMWLHILVYDCLYGINKTEYDFPQFVRTKWANIMENSNENELGIIC